MFLFTYRKVVKRPTPIARPGKWKEKHITVLHLVFTDAALGFASLQLTKSVLDD